MKRRRHLGVASVGEEPPGRLRQQEPDEAGGLGEARIEECLGGVGTRITRAMRDTQSSRCLQLGRRKAKPLMDIMPTVSGRDRQIHWGSSTVYWMLHYTVNCLLCSELYCVAVCLHCTVLCAPAVWSRRPRRGRDISACCPPPLAPWRRSSRTCQLGGGGAMKGMGGDCYLTHSPLLA